MGLQKVGWKYDDDIISLSGYVNLCVCVCVCVCVCLCVCLYICDCVNDLVFMYLYLGVSVF